MSEKGLFGTVTDLIPTMRAPPRLSVRQSLFTQCASAINAWPAQMKNRLTPAFSPASQVVEPHRHRGLVVKQNGISLQRFVQHPMQLTWHARLETSY